jgi:transcription elongation factor Elf1
MTTEQTEHTGTCPRCGGDVVERELVLQTTMNIVSGVILFCHLCGLTSKSLASDRERWFDMHKAWMSSALEDDTLEQFLARWTKKVERETYGSAEPIGPILPVPSQK